MSPLLPPERLAIARRIERLRRYFGEVWVDDLAQLAFKDTPLLLDALETAEQERDALKAALAELVGVFDDWVLAGERLSVVRDSNRVKAARAALAPTQPEGGSSPASLERKQ